jgi:hypothetical protein|tara:strand:- start:17174 stop:17494 length:321 start_codon:yes stop_codon:yes gene_type:complete
MKSKADIERTLTETEEIQSDDKEALELEDWCYNQGWIEALEWVLRDERMNKLLKGANNETIKKAQKRLAKDCGFGQRDDDSDIKIDSIRDGWLHGPQQFPSGHAKA